MIEIETRRFPFIKRNFWFVNEPFDVSHCDAAFFYAVGQPAPGFVCRRAPTFVIDLSRSEAELKSSLSKSCRHNCNRAIREGIEVRIDTDHAAFLELYKGFVAKKDFEGYVGNFSRLAAHGTLYTWYFEERLQGGLLLLEDDVESRWLMSGSRRLSTDNDPNFNRIMGRGNRQVLWEAIRDTRRRGQRHLDLGGYYDGDDETDPRWAITRFKAEFGGEPVERFTCEKYYSRLYRLTKRLRRWL